MSKPRLVAAWVLCVLITLGTTEICLRLLPRWKLAAPALALVPQEYEFWRYDADLGWSRVPGSSGVFSNGYFHGFVTNDEAGNRRNSRAGTYEAGYDNIFCIGDSTTASLEVDDDQTVPALLERELRARGQRVNVLNLGVRGYGTDQAVRAAIRFAPRYRPTDVIYTYVYNDLYDNSNLRRRKRRFGKGAYVKRRGDDSFHEYNYPVPRYPDDYAGLVLMDRTCEPYIYETTVDDRDTRWQTVERQIREHLYLYRALRFLARRIVGADSKPAPPSGVDPFDIVNSGDAQWTKECDLAYQDGGVTRERCHAYFDAQLKFLLALLRNEMPTVRRVHLVQFPDPSADHSTTVRLFSAMRQEGLIDSYVDLDDEAVGAGIDLNRLRCAGDPHFCEEGNRWIASVILERVAFSGSS